MGIINSAIGYFGLLGARGGALVGGVYVAILLGFGSFRPEIAEQVLLALLIGLLAGAIVGGYVGVMLVIVDGIVYARSAEPKKKKRGET